MPGASRYDLLGLSVGEAMSGEQDAPGAAAFESHLFKSLDERGRALLLDGARILRFEPESVIVREGDPGDALYVVKAGRVRVQTLREGRCVCLAYLEAGGCFGEVALLSGRPRTATVVAEERATLLCFPRQQIEDVLSLYPKVRRLLEALVLGRAKDTIEKLERVKAEKPPRAPEE